MSRTVDTSTVGKIDLLNANSSDVFDVQLVINDLITDVGTLQTQLAGILTDISNLQTLSGMPDGSVDLGTFTGTTIPDNSDNKEAFQALETEVELKEDLANKGVANGYCPLNGSTKIDATYLPSYVDDVEEYANLASFPITGETGKIYVAIDTGKTYRWSGAVYIEISPSEVSSVNGQTGAVVLDLNDIDDVDTTGVAIRNILEFDGTNWVDFDPNQIANDATSGSNVTLANPQRYSLIRLTSGTLVSVDMLPAGHAQQRLILINRTGVAIDINNDTGATAADRILTGTGATLTMESNAALILAYDSTSSRWQVVGGSGGGAINSDDIIEGVTNLFFTDERAQDAVGNNLLDTSSVNLTYNDGTGQISADVLPAGVDHDSLNNFVANEHINHTSVSINTNANSGLSGGGDISSSRSLLVDPTNATSVTAAPTDIILIADASDSNNLKKTTAQDIANLGGSASLIEFANDKSANQSISNNTTTKVTWQTPSIDTESAWDSVNNRWTAVNNCRVVVAAQIEFASGSTGYRTISVLKNGTSLYLYQINAQGGALVTHCQITTAPITLNSTDYLEIFCYQNNGGSLNVNTSVSTFWGITGRRL